jgi:hypothetical protein
MIKFTKFRWDGSTIYAAEFNQVTHDIQCTLGIKGKLEPLSKIAPNAEAKINCGYFGGTGVNLNEMYGRFSNGWTTVIYNDNGDQRMKLLDPELMDISTFNAIDKNNTFVIGAGYTLMDAGIINIRNTEPFPHYRTRNPRSMLAQRYNRNLLFIVADGRRWNESGLTAASQAKLCRSMGLYCAVNLDGGGSSQLMIGSRIMNRPSDDGERWIGSAIACFPK